MDNNKKKELPPAEELLKKIQELEESHARLKQEMSRLMISDEHQKTHRQRSSSVSPIRPRRRTAAGGMFEGGTAAAFKVGSSSFRHCSPLRRETRSIDVKNGGGAGGGVVGPSAVKLSETQYMNILQSMGQSVHIFDLTGQIIYWNRTAENLYGYTAAEALGKTPTQLLVDPKDQEIADMIMQRTAKGESWSGQFPVRNRFGERFLVIATNTPFREENGTLIGVICVSSDARPYQEMKPTPSVSAPRRIASAKLGLDPQQPLQTAIASKISNLASKVSNKVKSKMKTGDYSTDQEDDAHSSGASTPRGDIGQSPFGVFSSTSHDDQFTERPMTNSGDESEVKPGIHKILSSKAEAWMGKKGITWPWKGNEREGGGSGWLWQHNDQEQELTSGQSQPSENANLGGYQNEPSGSWSSSVNVNSTSSVSSYGSTSSSAINKVDMDTDSLDYEILWDDLIIGEQIGQGSCGTVYHALWYGSDVAVKIFSKQEYSEDVILSFRQEVSLMKRLRHPNILLFMGAVTSPQRLCIVTEFLPRGSLFRLLQRNTAKLDWRRRVHMAMDIARGMNYLHHCHPPIIHRDLKSSNLLVDKNWTVKVGDFGLSRIKHETYLTTKTGKGTPQWMAPEVLRNEQADEKSDVYSFGIVLWEITTEKIPWDSLNSMQVIGAVGFMNQRLDIPKDVDPQWASLMESCWCSEPQLRPTFQEILDKLKDLQKKFTVQLQASRTTAATGDNTQKEQ